LTDEQRLERWKTVGIRAWSAIGVLILIGVAMWVIGRLLPVLIPFLMAAVLVFLLRGPSARIERLGVPRWVAVLACYVVGVLLLVVAGVFIVPVLANQFAQFVIAFPGLFATASRSLAGLTQRYWTPAPSWLRDALSNAQQTFTAQLSDWGRVLAADVLTAGGSLVTLIVDSVLALFIAFYILVDLPAVRRELVLLAGPRRRQDAEVILREITTVIGGYLRGQAIIALANGVLTAIGLTIIRMPYSIAIGAITGVLSIIPYVGPVVGAIIVAVTGLFVSPALALLGVLVMIIVQQVEGNVLSPRIMSREVDLHPALVIFSLLVGAELAGVLGMLVAIPVAATGKALFAHYVGRAEVEQAAEVPPSGAGPAEPRPEHREGAP
jgi:predicted PurR-regulated permease PerM